MSGLEYLLKKSQWETGSVGRVLSPQDVCSSEKEICCEVETTYVFLPPLPTFVSGALARSDANEEKAEAIDPVGAWRSPWALVDFLWQSIVSPRRRASENVGIHRNVGIASIRRGLFASPIAQPLPMVESSGTQADYSA